MQNGYFYVDLDYVKRGQPWRSKDGRTGNSDHARAHSNYILRESAKDDLVTVNVAADKHVIKSLLTAYDFIVKERTEKEDVQLWGIPDGYQKHQLPYDYRRYGVAPKRGLIEYLPEGLQRSMRKDARLFYKVQHAFPVQMSKDAMHEATKRFAWSISGRGKLVVIASLHDLDTHNPHCHAIVIDKNVIDGKSVLLLSAKESERRQKGLEPNSTKWVRQLWEIDCNGVLAERGLDIRIDHRSNLERGMEAAREKHRGWEENASFDIEVDEAPSSPELPVDARDEEATLAPKERWMSELEKHYIAKLSPEERILYEDSGQIEREQYESTAQRVEDALEYDAEYQRLQAVQGEITGHREKAEQAARMAEEFEREATQLFLEAQEAEKAKARAEAELEPLKTRTGRLRGFQFKVFGLEVVSPKRKRALEASDRVRFSDWLKTIKETNAKAVEYSAAIQRNEAAHEESRQAATEIELVEHIHNTYGEDATLEKAEAIHVKSVSVALEGVQPHEVYAEYENGSLTAEQATKAFELMACPEMINAVEQRHRVELEQEAANDNGMEM